MYIILYGEERFQCRRAVLFCTPHCGTQKILQLKDDWREFGKAEKGHEDTNVGASKDDGAKTISAWL